MSELTLKDISKEMADIDFTMLSTLAENGEISSRPMSNNGEVEYQGDSYYFTWDESRMIADIERNPKVGLTFQGAKGLLGGTPFMIAIEGHGVISRDREEFKEHWTSDLDRWFPQGIDTPGVALIKVRANRVHYWKGEDSGELTL